MRACATRDWTDEIFALFIEGRLERLSAREVRRGIDWIEERPSLLARIDELPDGERRTRLATLVRVGAEDAGASRTTRPMRGEAPPGPGTHRAGSRVSRNRQRGLPMADSSKTAV